MENWGQYKILRKLGAGAMGTVYLAEHSLLKAKRALKVLPAELSASETFRERFLTEGRVLAGLRHPHIVQVHDMGVDDNVHYIAMEFVSPDGRQVWSLDRLLAKSGGRMQPGSAARVLLQVCEAIAYAHEQGVIHCDLKPSNILVVRDNEVCVSDFGLSKVLGQPYLNQSIKASLTGSLGLDETQASHQRDGANNSIGVQNTLNGNQSPRAASLVSTYKYMPPEVQKGGLWTVQGDIYSIGVLTYLLLTGELPVGRWKLPCELLPDLPSFWDKLVEGALHSKPSDRFLSVNAFMDFVRQQGTATHHSDAQCPVTKHTDVPVDIQKRVRDFVDAHQGQWTELLFLKFLLQIYENPKHAGISRKAIIEVMETERSHWLQIDAQRKEEKARLAEARRRAAVDAEQRFLASEKAKKCKYPVQDPSPGETLTFAGIQFVWIPAGIFTMGSAENEEGRSSDEGPQHRVTISRGFWLGKYAVTQGQWESVMGGNPSDFKGDDRLPVENVSWQDCQEFIKKLNAKGEGTFRLPTEAEWEYACRAGSTTTYFFGDNEAQLGDYAWYRDNSGSETHPVGVKKPNAWGLYDMHGNVWEWCQDWYDNYSSGAVTDPTGPSSGSERVHRGGSRGGDPGGCRSAGRGRDTLWDRGSLLGFRLALPAVQ